MNNCLICNKRPKRSRYIYCSNKCQAQDRYNKYIKKWKAGIIDGSRGLNTRNISRHLRRYLLEKAEGRCQICGWNKKNITTNRVPLEVDHLDGNSENNVEKNLRMVCPNCHSLSSTFRNLNKGKGRSWRVAKYIKN